MLKVKTDRKIIYESIHMAWPAIIESFFVSFAGFVDSYMVSAMGSSAVAAIGLTGQPKLLGLALFFALNVAISALIARRRGEQKQEEANRILSTVLLFVLLAGIVFTVIFVSRADEIIRFFGSAKDTHKDAVLYYRIIMGGMIFNCIQMSINAAQRGAGNTKITMRTNVTANMVNIMGNYLLIEGHFGFPALGIRGAALATVFGTAVGAVMSIISLMKRDGFISITYIFRRKILPSFDAFFSLIKVGYGVFFEQLLMRIGFGMTAIMAADQGTAAMAAHQVGMNIMSLSFAFGDGLQAAAVALIGYSLGEKNVSMAKAYGRACRQIGAVIAMCIAVIYFIGSHLVMNLFFEEKEIAEIGVQIIYVIIVIVVFQILQVIYMGCLRGAGDTLYTAAVSALCVTLIRTGVSWFCAYILGWGIIGVWLGVFADQFTRCLFAAARFQAGKWTRIQI